MSIADNRPELEPTPELSTESWLLTELGYEAFLDRIIEGRFDTKGRPVTGRNFLDAYKNVEARQHTEDTIEGFRDLDREADAEDYNEMVEYFQPFLTQWFGKVETGK